MKNSAAKFKMYLSSASQDRGDERIVVLTKYIGFRSPSHTSSSMCEPGGKAKKLVQ